MSLKEFLSQVIIRGVRNNSIEIVSTSKGKKYLCHMSNIDQDLKHYNYADTARRNNITVTQLKRIIIKLDKLRNNRCKEFITPRIPIGETSDEYYWNIKAFGHKLSDLYTVIED